MKGLLKKGALVEINGLPVEISENLHFEVVGATTQDQAAELCAAHRVPVDMEQFSYEHDHEDKGRVRVHYNQLGERTETTIQQDEAFGRAETDKRKDVEATARAEDAIVKQDEKKLADEAVLQRSALDLPVAPTGTGNPSTQEADVPRTEPVNAPGGVPINPDEHVGDAPSSNLGSQLPDGSFKDPAENAEAPFDGSTPQPDGFATEPATKAEIAAEKKEAKAEAKAEKEAEAAAAQEAADEPQ